MKSKYYIIVIIILFIVISLFSVSLFILKDRVSSFYTKIDDYNNRIIDLDKRKNQYYDKQEELDKIKIEKKNFIEKYEEVSLWNQEILNYLR